jgi:hypothetical protein
MQKSKSTFWLEIENNMNSEADLSRQAERATSIPKSSRSSWMRSSQARMYSPAGDSMTPWPGAQLVSTSITIQASASPAVFLTDAGCRQRGVQCRRCDDQHESGPSGRWCCCLHRALAERCRPKHPRRRREGQAEGWRIDYLLTPRTVMTQLGPIPRPLNQARSATHLRPSPTPAGADFRSIFLLRCDTLACYGNSKIEAPNLHRLAETSTVVEQAYVAPNLYAVPGKPANRSHAAHVRHDDDQSHSSGIRAERGPNAGRGLRVWPLRKTTPRRRDFPSAHFLIGAAPTTFTSHIFLSTGIRLFVRRTIITYLRTASRSNPWLLLPQLAPGSGGARSCSSRKSTSDRHIWRESQPIPKRLEGEEYVAHQMSPRSLYPGVSGPCGEACSHDLPGYSSEAEVSLLFFRAMLGIDSDKKTLRLRPNRSTMPANDRRQGKNN